MKFILSFCLAILYLNNSIAQNHASPCRNYSVQIVDDAKYWDTIIGKKSDPYMKIKKLIPPEQNLILREYTLTKFEKIKIDSEVACAIKEMNSYMVGLEGVDKPETSDTLISQKFYMTPDSLILGEIKAQTITYQWEIVVIIIIDKKIFKSFAYSNTLEAEILLTNLRKNKTDYVVWGTQKGNPEDSYYGNFKLKFSGHQRIIEYEFYEYGH